MAAATTSTPAWLLELLGLDAAPAEGEDVELRDGATFTMRDGILRAAELARTDSQGQTADAFGFKWQQGDSFASEVFLEKNRDWLHVRYGDLATADWWSELPENPVVLDAGCGAGVSGYETFSTQIARSRYLGVDISTAVDVAAQRFAERGAPAAFLQTSLLEIPLPAQSIDVIFSEGVLHHTDDTLAAFRALVPLLAPGGRILFYVYRVKGPIREFTDDLIRDRLQEMTPQEGWDALVPLTKLGIALGELGVEVDVPDEIELLGIPAGKIDIQRLFYWHIFKAYHRPEWSFEENHHVNYDWYAPRNAFRHTEDEVRGWCEALGLEVLHQHVSLAGITTHARRP